MKSTYPEFKDSTEKFMRKTLKEIKLIEPNMSETQRFVRFLIMCLGCFLHIERASLIELLEITNTFAYEALTTEIRITNKLNQELACNKKAKNKKEYANMLIKAIKLFSAKNEALLEAEIRHLYSLDEAKQH